MGWELARSLVNMVIKGLGLRGLHGFKYGDMDIKRSQRAIGYRAYNQD